ncbi:hypothetical protein ACFQ1E_08000 [Sphingomonas canadensis]|uniref:Uncharacterized protein n=1 Tax=Sphingomonas canadensis TaxID=1219257 RepID=A0ABW3H4W5_9SPHN|nr:hypothetical protein [Sphingomonas canadensis]
MPKTRQPIETRVICNDPHGMRFSNADAHGPILLGPRKGQIPDD